MVSDMDQSLGGARVVIKLVEGAGKSVNVHVDEQRGDTVCGVG